MNIKLKISDSIEVLRLKIRIILEQRKVPLVIRRWLDFLILKPLYVVARSFNNFFARSLCECCGRINTTNRIEAISNQTGRHYFLVCPACYKAFKYFGENRILWPYIEDGHKVKFFNFLESYRSY